MSPRVRGALLALLLPVAAQAGPYDGTYRTVANADCSLVGVDGGAIRIADGVFEGVETACRMTLPVDVIDMDAQLYTMECSGEGTAWTERALIMEKAGGDGIILVWNGYAFVYERCPAPEAAPEPDAAPDPDTAS